MLVAVRHPRPTSPSVTCRGACTADVTLDPCAPRADSPGGDRAAARRPGPRRPPAARGPGPARRARGVRPGVVVVEWGWPGPRVRRPAPRICTRGCSAPGADAVRDTAARRGVGPMTHGDRARHRRDQDARPGRRRDRRDPGPGPGGRPPRAPRASWPRPRGSSTQLRKATGEDLPRHRSGVGIPGLVDVAGRRGQARRQPRRRRRLAAARDPAREPGSACPSWWRTTSTPPPSGPSRSAAPTTSSTSASAPAWPPGWSSRGACAAASTAPPARSATCRSTRTARLCGCGQRGCLETIASGSALAAAWPGGDLPPAQATLRRRGRGRRAGDPRARPVRRRGRGRGPGAQPGRRPAHDRARRRRRPARASRCASRSPRRCATRPRRRRSWPPSTWPAGCAWCRSTTRSRPSARRCSAGPGAVVR